MRDGALKPLRFRVTNDRRLFCYGAQPGGVEHDFRLRIYLQPDIVDLYASFRLIRLSPEESARTCRTKRIFDRLRDE